MKKYIYINTGNKISRVLRRKFKDKCLLPPPPKKKREGKGRRRGRGGTRQTTLHTRTKGGTNPFLIKKDAVTQQISTTPHLSHDSPTARNQLTGQRLRRRPWRASEMHQRWFHQRSKKQEKTYRHTGGPQIYARGASAPNLSQYPCLSHNTTTHYINEVIT